LEAFAAQMFAPMPRSDQRAKGETYVRGLLLDGRRKSMQPMAARLGVDHQGLQQFVTTSTWDTMAVRARLAGRAVEVIDPVAWVFDDTGFPKDGTGSPGVARQYSGTLGKVANCQIGVSVHAVTDTASCPLDWRLFLPESWDPVKAGPAAVKAAKAKQRKTWTNARRATASDSPADVDVEAVTKAATEMARTRRRACAVPDSEGHHPKWMLAIEMLDGLATHGLRPPLVAADSGYGDSGPFRAALDERRIVYSVQVKGETLAHPADAAPVPRTWSGRGRPPTRTRPTTPVTPPAWPSTCWPPDPKQPSPSPGVRAAKALSRRSSCSYGSAPPGTASHATPTTAACPNDGSSPNGPTTNLNRSPTGCPANPPTPTPPT
jgi:SRSO17 transposase